jgi:16S rRNA (cytidine1402-2'-O)-methyltransferase
VPGTLYIVGTPIGNLSDITLRAIETLKKVQLIACEDTRHTKVLLNEYKIVTPTTSYHKFNIKTKTKFIVDQISAGKDIALVSDAGMPGISDPGEELIKAALSKGIKVEVIPGPCAVISALSVAGLRTDSFIFDGFLPTKHADRMERIKDLLLEKRTLVLYEAPHRLLKTLKDLHKNLGDRDISVCRELTKKFEEVVRGKISETINNFERKSPKGEFVLVIAGSGVAPDLDFSDSKLLKEMISAGISKSKAVKIAAKALNVSKNQLYRQSLGI